MARTVNKKGNTRPRTERPLGAVDGWVAGSVATLMTIGLIMVASSSISLADGSGLGAYYYLQRHLLFLGVGVGAGVLAMTMPSERLEQLSPGLLLLIYVCLMLVFVPGLGHTVNGSTRWVDLGVSKFQVAELAKLMLIVYVAGYLVRQHDQLRARLVGTLKPLMLAMLAGLLLLAQPDYGSAVLIFAITSGMVWLGGAKIRNVLLLGALSLPVMGSAALMQPYRIRRLTTFMDPWADPFADGFQLTQALIAVGRGEWSGVGLGGSIQKLFYLPEAHTDFILAVLAEETGLIGVAVILTLFTILVGRLFLLGMRAVESDWHFSGYLCFGVALWIGLQSLVSVGVNLGVLPTKGITLPFVSLGGSSILMLSVAVGLTLRVSRELNGATRARRLS